jgi:hypothetical protein
LRKINNSKTIFLKEPFTAMVGSRVARYFLMQYTKNGEKYTNLPLHFQMAPKDTKWP